MNATISFKTLAVAAAMAAVAGCSSVKLDDKAPVESRTGSTVVPGSGNGDGATSSQTKVASVDLASTRDTSMSNLPRIVYFDYDSYVVKDEFRPTIEANAKVLSADRKKHIAVEGYTDERGGSEYNLALGQRRAEAVMKSLTLLGVGDGQVEAVSFGKERPAVQGSTEEAYAKNRRAELTAR